MAESEGDQTVAKETVTDAEGNTHTTKTVAAPPRAVDKQTITITSAAIILVVMLGALGGLYALIDRGDDALKADLQGQIDALEAKLDEDREKLIRIEERMRINHANGNGGE